MLTEEEKNAGLEGKIIPINIEEQMKSAYIDYSMSVIVSRALPDVRDGLKPVHRRILYDMSAELNLYSDKPTRKSARIVGDVLGKFHPHGDSSVYEAMVRMAQDWSMRYPLVDGQGNFGSMDGDSPAAMRYTEARMQKITDEVMADIDKDTIDWTLNFDDTIPEPTVLPTKIPLLLVNGASGIAVGMATNMAPHNLGEVIDACCAFVDNPEIACEELLKYVKGPDFPTGGIIYGYEGVREALLTGRGRVVMRARTEIEHTASGRECIVITEIPYMVNKAEMIKKIADLINEKKIEGISYINDESDRNGMRIIVILKHDAVASVVLNTLYKNTPLQTSFAVNNIALVNGRPMMLNLLDLVRHFVEHRHDVIVRRTRFDLAKAEKRLHIVLGLLIAQDNIDEIIHIIRAAKNPDLAKQAMMERFSLSDAQASAIIEMRLRALTGLEHDKLVAERNELEAQQTAFRAKQRDGLALKERLLQETTRLENRISGISEQSGRIIERLSEYELTVTEANELAKPLDDESAAKKRVAELKSSIRALGSVNIEAIEEYKAVKERFDFLDGQMTDLKKSKTELEKIIRELLLQMTRIFTDSFERLNAEFGKTFAEMFGGGKGELILLDPDDVLNCGIDIRVAPPGKIIKNIVSLSGGEQAFTAIALYFAILRIRPTPFCMMDEIEAALDDVNVNKFASKLRDFCDKTQFIVITHRRGTMEEADVLYGVTMQEKGISKMLTIDVNEMERQLKL